LTFDTISILLLNKEESGLIMRPERTNWGRCGVS
jgi:hypothetical protein